MEINIRKAAIIGCGAVGIVPLERGAGDCVLIALCHLSWRTRSTSTSTILSRAAAGRNSYTPWQL